MKQSIYENIYSIVRLIPRGKVATYGQIANIVGGCTARMVGYAMAALPSNSDVPWQRVLNHKGKTSTRASGDGDIIQLKVLETEGIRFDENESIKLEQYRWTGPEMVQYP